MSLMQRISAGALALMVLSLAACSSKPDTYEQYNFKSAEEFAKVVEEADWNCVLAHDQAQTDDSLSKYGFDSTPCNRGAVVIYASDAKRTELTEAPQNELTAGQALLQGGNWAVVGDQFKVVDAKKILGGTLTLA